MYYLGTFIKFAAWAIAFAMVHFITIKICARVPAIEQWQQVNSLSIILFSGSATAFSLFRGTVLIKFVKSFYFALTQSFIIYLLLKAPGFDPLPANLLAIAGMGIVGAACAFLDLFVEIVDGPEYSE